MDANTIIQAIIQAIGSVGFPIVACIYMAYIHNESEIRHSLERKEMTEAVNRNTTVLEIIKDHLNIGDDGK